LFFQSGQTADRFQRALHTTCHSTHLPESTRNVAGGTKLGDGCSRGAARASIAPRSGVPTVAAGGVASAQLDSMKMLFEDGAGR